MIKFTVILLLNDQFRFIKYVFYFIILKSKYAETFRVKSWQKSQYL